MVSAVRAAQAGRAQPRRAVPVPRRADRLVQRPRRDRALPLLRLRRLGRRVPLRAGDRARRLRGRRRAAGRRRPGSRSATRPAARAGTAAGARSCSRPSRPAVEWYHQRLLTAPDGRGRPGLPAQPRHRRRPSPAGSGSVGRPTTGTRWSPAWPGRERALRESGLAFLNRRNRLQDAFRARVLFPIFNEAGEAVAFGGRILPGSTDPAKYKNSPETAIYRKSKTLYGLSWAKSDIVKADQVVVCEGYTDVIGFHQAGVPDRRRDVRHGADRGPRPAAQALRQPGRPGLRRRRRRAGRGRALLRVGAAVRGRRRGGAAAAGQGPGRAGRSGPGGAAARRSRRPSRSWASGWTGCSAPAGRVAHPGGQGQAGQRGAWPWSASTPTSTCASSTPGRCAQHTGLPVADLVKVAERRAREVEVRAAPDRPAVRENAEFVALALLVQRWDDIAPWLVEPLFADETNLGAVPRPGRGRRRRPQGHRAGRPRGPRPARAGQRRRRRRRLPGRGAQPDRCGDATGAGGAPGVARPQPQRRAGGHADGSSSSSTTPKPAGTAAGQLLRWLAGRPERRREELG